MLGEKKGAECPEGTRPKPKVIFSDPEGCIYVHLQHYCADAYL